MSDLSSLTSLLVQLEEERKKAINSERREDLFDCDTSSRCLKQINSATSSLLSSRFPDYQRSSKLFEVLLIKRTLLLCFELLCYSKKTRVREMKELFTAVQAFNSHANTSWKRETFEESMARKKDEPAVAVSFADVADIMVLCCSGVISWRVEREGVAAVQQWWLWAEEERARVREVMSMLAAETSLLAAGGRCVSVEAAVRVTEGRLWKEVGRRVTSREVQEALKVLIDGDGGLHSCTAAAAHKCAWYLGTVGEVQDHSSAVFTGLNTLLVRLSVSSLKGYRASSSPALIHEHLASSILTPLSTAFQHLKQHCSLPLHSILLPPDHTRLALYLDTLISARPLLLLLTHSLWAVARWLSQGLQLSLSAMRMASISHLLLVEGVESTGALREALLLAAEVAAPVIKLPRHSPHWLMEEVQKLNYTAVHRCWEWMEEQMYQWCEGFFSQWKEQCSQLLNQVFPSPTVWARAGKKRTTPTCPSPYTTPLLEQLLVPLCEAGSLLPPPPQRALMFAATSLLILELRRSVLSCRHKLKQGACHQLQVDFQHLLSHLTSAESGLHHTTRQQLRGLSTCVDMRQGLAVLSGEEGEEEGEEEEEEEETPLRFEGELGRLLHSLAVVDEVGWLSIEHWR